MFYKTFFWGYTFELILEAYGDVNSIDDTMILSFNFIPEAPDKPAGPEIVDVFLTPASELFYQ